MFVHNSPVNASVGKTEQERINVDIMLENAMDFRNGVVRMAYNPEYVNTFYGLYEPFLNFLTLGNKVAYEHYHIEISSIF